MFLMLSNKKIWREFGNQLLWRSAKVLSLQERVRSPARSNKFCLIFKKISTGRILFPLKFFNCNNFFEKLQKSRTLDKKLVIFLEILEF